MIKQGRAFNPTEKEMTLQSHLEWNAPTKLCCDQLLQKEPKNVANGLAKPSLRAFLFLAKIRPKFQAYWLILSEGIAQINVHQILSVAHPFSSAFVFGDKNIQRGSAKW